jgi:hypothetical protein
MGFVSLCIKFPNLDTIIFYVVFVMLVPYFLFTSGDYDTLKYYLPMLVMAAVTLTEAGKPDLFKSLYPLPPDSISGWFSKNIINLLAVTGILVQVLKLTLESGNMLLGLVSALVGLTITFPMAQEVLPVFIREGDKWFKSLSIGGRSIQYPGNWHKYFLGFLFAIFLILCEYLIMTLLYPQLVSNMAKNSVLNNLV